jgi:hypothetical protein
MAIAWPARIADVARRLSLKGHFRPRHGCFKHSR